MPTIDELIIRLDADLQPLENALRQATARIRSFATKADRDLRRMEQRAAAISRSSRPSLAGSTATPTGSGGGTTAPSQSSLAGQQVVLQLGPAVAQALVGLATSIGGSVIFDRFLSGDPDLLKRVVPEERSDLRPRVAGRTAVEFFEAARINEELAKNSFGPNRLELELKAEQFREFGNRIQEELEKAAISSVPEIRSSFGRGIRPAQFEGTNDGFATTEETKDLRAPLVAELNAIQSGEAFDPESFRQAVNVLLEAARTPRDVEDLSKLLAPLQKILEGIDIAERRFVGPALQRRINPTLQDQQGQLAPQPESGLAPIPVSFGGAATSELREREATVTRTVEAEERLALAVQRSSKNTAAHNELLVQSKRETIELNRVARDLGFTFSSALEDAIVNGEKFSEILQGLERDILRILTRTLITEPIAEGIRGGIQGDETSAGGLEGLLNKVFGTAGVFFGEEEAADTGAETSDAAEQAATSLLAMGNAGDTTGALLRDSLSEGAAKAGIETLTQASTSAVATTQLGELAIAAGTAAAALQALVATAGAGGAGGGGGGPLGLLSNIAGVGQFLTPVLGNSVTGGFGTSNPLATGFSGNPHFASGGRVGGRVSGPGGPLSDSIPAFLSDGEFVVNAEATRRHRRLLELINAGITPPAFATGGQVAPFLRFANADMTPSPAARAPRREAAPDTLMRPIVVNINGVTDPGSFQRSRAQLRGQLREMISRAEKRDD